ncbi:MAG: carboxypeptidase-like regulatory domain-containing protein, partial [Bacteroidia bacterium]|nr:carboxypeptidase-like regulatory domain-containing protein [Bacteroidia bacterium]
MKWLNIIVIIVIFNITVSSQERPPHGENMPSDGNISGTIKDPDLNQLIPYANVILYRLKDSSIVTGAIADEKGNFTLSKLPYGKFYLEIHFIGYEKKFIPEILLTPRQKDILLGIIELRQTATQLNEVEVVGERKFIEYKIDKKIINVSQDIVASGGMAADVLENTPSVQIDIDGNISLRGSTNFTVLIDGKPSITDGNELLQQTPAGMIENIEIITNPSAKYDPDGIAGIINIIMKKQKEKGTNGIINANVGTSIT